MLQSEAKQGERLRCPGRRLEGVQVPQLEGLAGACQRSLQEHREQQHPLQTELHPLCHGGSPDWRRSWEEGETPLSHRQASRVI
eukprot:6789736-Prymnesium_polylepis.1